MVTVPKWIENKLAGRKPLDLKNVNMVIYDEADEIFMQEGNHSSIAKLKTHLEQKLSLNYQTVLFSATFNDQVQQQIRKFFEQLSEFKLKTEALKLKGVKQFRLVVNAKDKLKFINDVYVQLDGYQTMIFVQKKTDATNLQDQMSKMGIKAEKLIGETDPKMRD
jgi:superfamily II DNA/RNA helicase